jgi:hypothetical protein
MLRLGMLAHIGQRLLQDANELDFGQRSNIQLALHLVFKAGGDLRLDAEFLQVFFNRRNHTLLIR